MPWAEVNVAVDHSVRALCAKPYPNHRKGCPNLNKKAGCPPQAQFIENVLDLSKTVYAVWNRFDLAEHRERMRAAHPQWSRRQLDCCLYWQPKARKQLRVYLHEFLQNHRGLKVIGCPEACGVNITETMKSAGRILEWPPENWTYQIVLIGTAKDGGR